MHAGVAVRGIHVVLWCNLFKEYLFLFHDIVFTVASFKAGQGVNFQSAQENFLTVPEG